MISCGVLSSLPSQNGQNPEPEACASVFGTTGRLARSVAMITHRPTSGSLPHSGMGRPCNKEAHRCNVLLILSRSPQLLAFRAHFVFSERDTQATRHPT